MPYRGPASAYRIVGKTMSAYFRMINDNGGINGRRITFISYDDACSPPKTLEQAKKLAESDEVFLIFAALGTATNAAIQKYTNTKRVPPALRPERLSAPGATLSISLDDRLAAQLPH